MTINTTYNSFMSGTYNCSAVKIGSVPVPDYNAITFYTYNHSSLSDDEWRDMIVGQAKKDQSQGKFQAESQEWLQLHNDFTSSVSPDRKVIIDAALTKIQNATTVMGAIDFIELWLNGRVVRQQGTIQVEFATFYDSSGKEVAFYAAGKGWSSIMTDAEVARLHELTSIYNEAWNAAAKGKTSECSSAHDLRALLNQPANYQSVVLNTEDNEAWTRACASSREETSKNAYMSSEFSFGDDYSNSIDAIG